MYPITLSEYLSIREAALRIVADVRVDGAEYRVVAHPLIRAVISECLIGDRVARDGADYVFTVEV